MKTVRILTLAIALALLVAGTALAGSGRVVIVNNDVAGSGFNDNTPVAPVGGNPGTTLGQQRLYVFEAAARHWTRLLDTNVDVLVSASFTNIAGCTSSEGVLGQAAPLQWRHSFAGAPKAKVWYPIALANKLAGVDLDPARADIFAQFNTAVDNATCLGESDWYYGIDNQHGTDINLYSVVLHELAHGLGFSAALSAPGFKDNIPSVFDIHAIDTTLGLRWDQMTEQQRQVSMTNSTNLAWDGDFVRGALGRFLGSTTRLTISSPAVLAGDYDIGSASFGADPSTVPAAAPIVQMTDAATEDGPTTTDGCTTPTNAAALAGKLALIDRGTCTFVTKARHAQAAGAAGVVIVDNTRTTCTPPGMGGDAPDITLPVISIGANDGDAIKAQLGAGAAVDAALRVDATQLAGTTREGFLRLYAPCTTQPGSSVYHWDVVAQPNLLMEPNINADLLHDLDLTLYFMLDIGWSTRTGRTMLRR